MLPTNRIPSPSNWYANLLLIFLLLQFNRAHRTDSLKAHRSPPNSRTSTTNTMTSYYPPHRSPHSPQALPFRRSPEKMSITQTFYLAHKARGKLSSEASRQDHNLRLLVGKSAINQILVISLSFIANLTLNRTRKSSRHIDDPLVRGGKGPRKVVQHHGPGKRRVT